MTIVLLASVSLLALVVTSRPILSSNADLNNFASTSSVLQTSVQTSFQIHPGKDDLTPDTARFHFLKPKQHVGYSSELGKEAIANVEFSFEEPPSFEATLDEIADDQSALDANNEHNDTVTDGVTNEPTMEAPTEGSSTPLVVLVFSCIAAFLSLACIALSLYIMKSLRSQMLASKTAWQLLPRFRRGPSSKENAGAMEKHHLSSERYILFQSQHILDPEEGFAQRHQVHPGDRPLYFDAVSDIESEWDDADEKYQDALDMTPLPLIHDLPLEDNVSHSPHHSNPPLSHFGSHLLDPLTADRSMPPMCESWPSPTPVSRPAWSVRAIYSPALGLSSREGGDGATLQPLIHPRRRAYRSPVPEFDIALAMQLRPGLGIGADSAWMVRFLMTIFGWFAIALTGNNR